MQQHRFLLQPLSGFHLQSGGAHHEHTRSFVRSDTLSSALIHLYYQQYGEQPLNFNALPFHCSSLMPALQPSEEEVIYLYPRPANEWDIPKQFLDLHKTLKAVKWLSEGVLRLISNGESLVSLLPKDRCERVCKDEVLITKEEATRYSEFFTQHKAKSMVMTHNHARVTLDRVSSSSMPYSFSVAYFQPFVKLWGFLDCEDSFFARFKALLRLLGEEGVGGDRTIGLGQFELIKLQQVDTHKTQKTSSTHWLNLAPFNPTAETVDRINWEASYFDWDSSRGWTLKGSLRRKSIRMLNEGSTFVGSNKPEGRVLEALGLEDGDGIVQERIGHPVYRDLRGYFIPLESHT